MKNSLEMLGYRVSPPWTLPFLGFDCLFRILPLQVTKVRLTSLVQNTYMARVHYAKGRKVDDGSCHEVDVDVRPSDAVNMAVRFDAPIYINKQVARSMGTTYEKLKLPTAQTSSEIITSCKDLLMHFPDPTVVDKLHLQLAIAEERYDDATV